MNRILTAVLAVVAAATFGCGRSQTYESPDGKVKVNQEGGTANYEVTTKEGKTRVTASEQENSMGTKLYVGNLSYDATENDLQVLFAQAGAVTSVNLMLDRATGKPRGFAFVEMATEADTAKAISMLNGKELKGRALTVNEARPKEERGGGGGGGYRGGGRDRGTTGVGEPP